MQDSGQQKAPRRELDRELDRLERKINEVRVLYEQYFVDILPRAPEQEVKEIQTNIRQLLKAPFKNSQTRFRLRQLVTRFQTYSTYWERVNKQREEGTYKKDVFRAEMREKMTEDIRASVSQEGAAEKGISQLYNSYKDALKKSGGSTENVNFDSFKQTLIKKARHLRQEHGVTKLQYKVVQQNGKVIIKATKTKKQEK